MRTALLVSLAILLGLLAACGGGGDGAGIPGGSNASTGSVTLLLAHDPAEAYKSIFVTVYEVALLAEGKAPVVLFESVLGREIDLLELRTEDMILAVRDVPAGVYHKLRLQIGDVLTVGGPCDDLPIKVPSEHVDLNPREPIEVVPGGALRIRLDLDAAKSLYPHVAGKSGKCIFTPVIFVDIESVEAPDRCPRSVFGTIEELVVVEEEVVGFFLDLGEGRGLLKVLLEEKTGIFDGDGLATVVDSLGVDDEVTVKGRLDAQGRLHALAIVQGEALVVEGTATSDLDEGVFTLEPDDGEAISGETDVSVVDATLVQYGCDVSDSDVIVEDARVTVLGKFDVDDGMLRAVAVTVHPETVEGALVEVGEVFGGWQIAVRPEGKEDLLRIFVPEEVGILLEGDGRIPIGLLQSLLECEERGVVVHLAEDAPGAAREVRVESAALEGAVDDFNASTGHLTVDGTEVAVLHGATVLDLRDGQALASLADLHLDDTVRLFGLEGCEESDADLFAFVVLILPGGE